MHPEKPGRPVLAIECDGASYHSSATARDRDRLRQAHLQRLGWRFHRIWSTDWFYSREQELERLVVAYKDAVRRADLADTDVLKPPVLVQAQSISPTPTQPTALSRGPRPPVPAYDNIDQYSEQELQQLAEWIASDGLLRTNDELIREMFEALPYERMGGRIRTRLEDIAQAVRVGRTRENLA